MMFCKLTKNGVVGRGYDPDKGEYEMGVVDSLLPYLLHEVTEVEDGFTVRDLLNILKEHKKEVNEDLVAYTCGIQIDPFIDELEKEKENDPGIDRVVFQRYAEIDKDEDDDLEPFKKYEERINVHGMKNGEDTHYAIDFVSMNEIADSIIELEESFYIHYHNRIYEEKDFGFYWMKIDKRPFTLIDVIGSFLWEITFNGYPDNRQERIDTINERSEGYDDEIEAAEEDIEEERTFMVEEMELEFQEEKLEKLLEKEEYEKADKVRKRIEDIKEEIFRVKGKDYEIKKFFSDVKQKAKNKGNE